MEITDINNFEKERNRAMRSIQSKNSALKKRTWNERMYGSTNNPNASMSTSERNDIMSYGYKDTVVIPEPMPQDTSDLKASFFSGRTETNSIL